MATTGYLRVSTVQQETEKNKFEILEFANQNHLGEVTWVEETVSGSKSWKQRKIADVINGAAAGDTIIVNELSRLGRSMLECMEMLAVLSEKSVNLYAIKGNWKLENTLQSKIIAMVFAIAAEIEREMISRRTKEALAARKRSGEPIGRPTGPGRSKLDPHIADIQRLLHEGVTQVIIAERFDTTPENLSLWLRKRNLR